MPTTRGLYLAVVGRGATFSRPWPSSGAPRVRRTGGCLIFSARKRPIDRDILGKSGIEAIPQVVTPVPALTKPWLWTGFYLKWRESVLACIRSFRERRPAAVLGAGGYASGPPVHAALNWASPRFC
jgi:hypothetical protein